MADEEYPIRPLTIYARRGNAPDAPQQVAQNFDWGTAKVIQKAQPQTATDWDWSNAPVIQKGDVSSPVASPSPPAASPVQSSSAGGTPPSPEREILGEATGVSPAPSLFERAFGALPHLLDYPKNVSEMGRGGLNAMSAGVENIKEGNYGQGALQTGLGALGYVGAPLTGAAKTVAGDPVRRVTGSEKLGNLAEIAAGVFAPGPKVFEPLRKTGPARTTEKIFSPTTAGPVAGEAEASIRKFGGQAARDTAQTEAALEAHQRLVSSMDETARRNFISYVEGRPARMELTPYSAEERLANGYRPTDSVFSIKKNGEDVGAAFVKVEGDTAKIEDIYSTTGERAGSLGTKDMRELMRVFMAQHPEVKKFSGERVSGARNEGKTVRLGEGKNVEAQARVSESPKLPPEQQMLADKIREAYAQRRRSLENLTRTQQMNFIDDYFVHQWEDPAAARQFFSGGGSKEGRTGFTRGRSIPTVEEGIAAGLKPKTLDPIEATVNYVNNADRFIATERTFEEARDLGTVKYYLPGKQPNGWVKVNGRLGEKGALDAYAPEDWARVYNNFIDRGLQGPWRSVYDAAQKTSNAVTALELGLSAYHARTMAKEAIINQVAKAIGQGVHMRPGQALKTIAGAPLAPITMARTGSKLEKAYLGSAPATQQMKKIADLLTEAGGRGKGGVAHTGGEYAFSRNGDFVKAWKRGTLKMEMLADLDKMKTSPILGTAKVGAHNIGRIMTTVAAPLFEKYIPRLKNGAFYENMGAWLEHNPGASHEMQVKAARDIWDSVDNRFGEMVKDNIFWNKTFKQVAQLAARSYSWDLGTVREIGGGVKDLAAHKWSPRAEYLIALPITDGIGNAVYQYLKTGQAPQSLMDLAAPRTGGVNADGTEERAGPIGYMRDVYGWMEDPVQEATNKVATAPRTALDLLRNKDWRNMPIAPPTDKEKTTYENTAAWLSAYLGYVGQHMVPISAQAFKRQPDSNVPLWERLLGTQPAGMKYTDPERLESVKDYFGKRDWRAKERADAKEKAKYEGVNP